MERKYALVWIMPELHPYLVETIWMMIFGILMLISLVFDPILG
jgi:hypothetical protein